MAAMRHVSSPRLLGVRMPIQRMPRVLACASACTSIGDAARAASSEAIRVSIPDLQTNAVDRCLEYDMSLYTPIDVPGVGKIGCVCSPVAEALAAHPSVFHVDLQTQLVTMRRELDTFEKRTEAMVDVANDLKARGFLGKWRDELFPATMGFDDEPAFAVERAVVSLLGLRGYGVHANGLVRDESAPGGYRLWVGRRAADKATWPGKLDHLAAGGQPLGLDPYVNMVKECGEEAGIPPELCEKGLHAAGAVSYRLGETHTRMVDGASKGVTTATEVHTLKRDVLFVYDLELPADFTPVPVDGEVESFELMDLQTVVNLIAETEEFKPNVALVIVDMLVRRGIVTAESKGYLKLIKSLRLIDCA